MAQSNFTRTDFRLKLVYTGFNIDVKNIDLAEDHRDTINKLNINIQRDMTLNDFDIILAGEGESAQNRNFRLRDDASFLSTGYILNLIDKNCTREIGAAGSIHRPLHWVSNTKIITFYIIPKNDKLLDYLIDNVPNNNINNDIDIMRILHELNTQSPLSNTTIERIHGECCVCLAFKELHYRYACNLGEEGSHGLCDGCWNQWHTINNTCPLCRAVPGTPQISNQPANLVEQVTHDEQVTHVEQDNYNPDDIIRNIANTPFIRIQDNNIIISNIDYQTIHHIENNIYHLNNNNDDEDEIMDNENNLVENILNVLNSMFISNR